MGRRNNNVGEVNLEYTASGAGLPGGVPGRAQFAVRPNRGTAPFVDFG